MSKLFNLNPRKPNTLNEEAARKLEEAIAAKGEGVAGQAGAAVAPQAHELTSSAEAPVEVVSAPVPVEAAPAVVEVSAVAPAPVRNAVSSRARSATKPRAPDHWRRHHAQPARAQDRWRADALDDGAPAGGLAKKLAVHCAMTGRKQSDVIAEAVDALLA